MTYRLTRRAAEDIESILAYTLEQWGAEQVAIYAAELKSVVELLDSFPGAGRATGAANREFIHAPYIIYYRRTKDGILVGRIIHGAQRHE